MKKIKIPYGKNVYGKEEISAVIRCLKTTTQMSKNVATFEKKIAKTFGKKYGIMVNSGSSAILLALKILNFKKGSEVIIPCLNFGTAISSLILSDLNPVFVDVDKFTLQIDEKLIEKRINKKTCAILIPNLIGNIPNWPSIKKIAIKYNLKLIEDSADTLGAKINNKPTGIYSDMTITSFYGSHVISCAGNGGMLVLNSKKDFDKGKIIRSWGRLSSTINQSENIKERLNIKLSGIDYDRKFVFSEMGYNFEPSEIGAAFGLEQLKKFKKFSKKRNENYFYHYKFFKKLTNFFYVPVMLNKVYTNFLAYPVIIKDSKKINRKKLQIYLEKQSIQTRPIFTGNSLRHPAFKALRSSVNNVNKYPNSDYIMKNGILIGCHQGLNTKNLDYIHKHITNFVNDIK